MGDTMRAALESAFEKHTKEEPTEGGTPASASDELGAQTGGSPADPPVTVGTPPSETKDDEGKPPVTGEKPAEGKPPVTGEKSAEGKPAEGKPPAKETVGVDKTVKPPVSWKPAIRQHWDKLPVEVRQEVIRREAEIQRGLATASQARNFQDEFNEVVRPFEGIIRSQNSTPIAAVRNLMTTAAALTYGSPVQKANVIAEILQNYGVDINVLDQVLAGKAPKENEGGNSAADIEARVHNLVQAELAPVRNMVNARHEEQSNLANTEVETFAASHEFAEDLADDMADILEIASKRGRKMTMQQAYDTAARAHPEIGPLYEKMLVAKAANNGNARAEAARRAASSVRPGGPTGGSAVAPTDLRGAISAAFDQHARRV